MNKQTKMILGIAAVGVVGFLIYKSMNKPKANAVGRTGRLALPSTTLSGCVSGDEPACNVCGESCMNNICYVPIYGDPFSDKITSYRRLSCTGTASSQIGNPV